MIEDRYRGVQLHHTLIDWRDETLTPDDISAVFLGVVDHWDDPDFEGMEHHEIEREILLEAGRDNWHGISPYGKPYYQHYLTLMKILLPQTDITPTIADAVMFFCLGIGWKKIMNLIGSQNAGKSAGAIRIVFTAMYIDVAYTVAWVANPFDNAADATVWGDVEELWDEMCEAWPLEDNADAPSLFPEGRLYKDKCLVFQPKLPKAGRIELKNVKKVGKYKGSKTRGKQTHRGVMFVIVDEINEIENFAFLTALSNLSSQDAFFGITSQNFKDEEDMGGQLCQPVPTYGGVETYDDLDLDDDLFWHSIKASITLRFDGHRAPNILAQRVIYGYLLKQKDLDRLREEGGSEESLVYYSQARSFPIRGGDIRTVLSKSKVSASRHIDPHYQLLGVGTPVSFVDPAFGGRDSAIYVRAVFGRAAVLDAEGKPYEQELLVFPDFMRRLKLKKNDVYDDYWLERLMKLGLDISGFRPGDEVSFEDQIAIQCAEMNRTHGIPPENFGYDFSMRADVVASMIKIVGDQCVGFDYNHDPEGRRLEGLKKDTLDCCYNRNTELAFQAADLYLTKQIRGGNFIEAATTQLQRTYYEVRAKKYISEDKKAYKARWEQRSPDHRDALEGVVDMAHQKGFRKNQFTSAQKKGGSVLRQLYARNIGKSRVAVELPD